MTSIRKSNRTFRLVVGIFTALLIALIAAMWFSAETIDTSPNDFYYLAWW